MAPDQDSNVQRDLGMLRGEMGAVQKDIERIEGKVDIGFRAIQVEIQKLGEDRGFARGVGYVITGIIAAVVSAAMVFLARLTR